MQNRWARFLTAELVLCLILLVIWPHLSIDDSYIFLTYARNFAATGTFTFAPGHLSYGFSSPAYLMLLAGVSRLTHLPVSVALSNGLGVVLCCLASMAAWSLWDVIGEPPANREIPFAAILFSGPWFFTVWFLFGMETGLAVTSILGFLLWLARLRAGDLRLRWLLLGLLATGILAITRLESSIFIAVAIALTLVGARSLRQVVHLLTVALFGAAVEFGWLLYAHHIFGTYMPWSSTARLIYYLPGRFSLVSNPQYYGLGFFGHIGIALKAAAYMVFAGPMKILLVFLPIAAAIVILYVRREISTTPSRRSPLEVLRQIPVLNWILAVGTLGMLIQIAAFAYLFPLAQNRHLAPYIAGIWVLIVPVLTRLASRAGRPLRAGAFAAAALLWIGGAIHFRIDSEGLWELHQVAASGLLTANDKVATEPIGILSFETPARIVDLGGLSDRDIWPLLTRPTFPTPDDFIAWSVSQGATKLLLPNYLCDPASRFIGKYCLIDAAQARALLHNPRDTGAASRTPQ